MNLLIAIDGSEFSTAAVRRVAAMSWPAGSRVLLLAVVRSDVLLVSDFFVSATGRTGISRLVLGSVAAHVVAHAGSDVLVVRNRVQVPA